MPTRVRKLVGSVGVVLFLAAYVWIVTLVADHIPRNVAVETLFYAAAGLLWGAPLIPLIRWMNGSPEARP